MYSLGIDAGSTSLKVILFDEQGNIQSKVRVEYCLEYPKPNFVEIDAEHYWKALKNGIHKILATCKIDPAEISSLAISSQGETFVPIKRDGRHLRKAIVWYDNRSIKECKIIRDHFTIDEIFKITGQTEVIPTWTATKILWLKRNEPKIHERIDKYLLVEDYLTHKLSQEFATDYSVVCSTLLFDIRKKRWWSEILDVIGICEDQLPQPLPSGTAIGTLSASAARELGLSQKTLIATGAYDHAAGAVGAGNIAPGILSETTGAAMGLVASIQNPLYDPCKNMPVHYHALEDMYFLHPSCPTAGIILRWFRDNFSQNEVEKANQLGVDPYEIMTAKASQIPPGSDQLIVLPCFTGGGLLEFDPLLKGGIAGLTLAHTKDHLIRSIMESIGYMLKHNIKCLESILNSEIKEIRSVGGAVRSPLWNQIKSDITGKRLLTFRVEEAACLGAAILSTIASGTFPNIEKAVEAMTSIKRIYDPIYENKKVYDRNYQIFLTLYNNMKNLFK